jgi:hypothetical protein
MATTLMPELPREFLAAARKRQEYALDALRTWVRTVQSVIPGIPAAQIPFADRLPKPEAVLASAYDFAGQLLASQRHFAEELLKATGPLMPAVGSSRNAPDAPETPAASTPSTPSTPRTAATAPEAPAARTTRTAPEAPAARATRTAPEAPAARATRTAPKAP